MSSSLKKGVWGLVMAFCWVASTVVATPQSPTRTVIAECGVYPQTVHANALINKQPLHPDNWDASPQELLSQFPNSLIKVNLDPSVHNFLFVSWLGSDGSGAGLNSAFTQKGTLGQGFNEAPPPLTDTLAISQLNQQLQVGDWVQALPNTATISRTLLNTHVANKTIMIIPLHDLRFDHGTSQQYHVRRFVAVRLIGFNLVNGQKFMLFALLDADPQYSCFEFDDQATVAQSVPFTSLVPFDSTTSQLIWDFGDGTTSTDVNPSHSYATTGTYTVSLAVVPPNTDLEQRSSPFFAQGVVHVAPITRWMIWVPTVQQD